MATYGHERGSSTHMEGLGKDNNNSLNGIKEAEEKVERKEKQQRNTVSLNSDYLE